jgi:uncharacterized membrane protein
MVSAYEIENALRARNTRLLRRALRLEFDERCDLIKNMPMYQFQAAAQLLIEHGENANKIQRMAERNKVEVNKQTTVRDILVQAAEAGDEEAIELLSSGLSQEKIIE